MDLKNQTAYLNLKPTKINQYGLPFKVKPTKVFIGEPNDRSSSVLVRSSNRDINHLNVSSNFDATTSRNSVLLSPLKNDAFHGNH